MCIRHGEIGDWNSPLELHTPSHGVSRRLVLEGFSLAAGTESMSSEPAAAGVLGSVQPGRGQAADIEFGWPLLAELAELDVGQTMAVRERDVIAVQAIEPTAELIERAGELCRARGWVLLRTARADSSHPAVVDEETIRLLAAAGGGCLAIAAGRVRLVGGRGVIEAADRAGIAVVGMTDGADPRVTSGGDLAELSVEDRDG